LRPFLLGGAESRNLVPGVVHEIPSGEIIDVEPDSLIVLKLGDFEEKPTSVTLCVAVDPHEKVVFTVSHLHRKI
jgi:hypothetical protein